MCRGQLQVRPGQEVRAACREGEAGMRQGGVSLRAGQLLPQETRPLTGQNAWEKSTSSNSSGRRVTHKGRGQESERTHEGPAQAAGTTGSTLDSRTPNHKDTPLQVAFMKE